MKMISAHGDTPSDTSPSCHVDTSGIQNNSLIPDTALWVDDNGLDSMRAEDTETVTGQACSVARPVVVS